MSDRIASGAERRRSNNLLLIKSRTKTFEVIGLGLGASLAMLVPVVGDWPVRLVVALCFAGTGWMAGLMIALLFPKR